MALEPLFVVDAQPDEIWELYLRSFPPGTDPIFRERTEHNCACCRNFIRDLGGVVAVQNGALATIWDLSGLPEPYQPVADALAAFVRSRPVAGIVLGNKTKCPPSAQQMSGVGFSSTRRDDVIVLVAGAKSKRAYRVQF